VKLAKLGDLGLRLADGGRRGKILRSSLAADLPRDLKVRARSGIAGPGAMASGFSAAAECTGDGAWLEVAEFGDLAEQLESLVDKSNQWVGHRGLRLLHIL
jgi:hypothetical protein